MHYPGLDSHPQHTLARQQQKAYGAAITFEIVGGRREAWAVIDNTRLFSITANLGDTKSTITHPASTTHRKLTAQQKSQAGITEGLIRISVGLEDLNDIQQDLTIALAVTT